MTLQNAMDGYRWQQHSGFGDYLLDLVSTPALLIPHC